MKRLLIAMLLLAVLAIAFTLSLAWYAGYKWKNSGKIPMHNNEHLIAHIEETAFSDTFPCLSFLSGIIYHGQDTFELVKFSLRTDDSSWNVLSNRIFTSKGYMSFGAELLKDTATNPYLHFENLKNVDEVLVGMLDMGEMALYITHGKDVNEQFVYLEGTLIPALRLEELLKSDSDSKFRNQRSDIGP